MATEIYSPIPVAVTATPATLLESSSAAAIARFRPTPKEIIGRIAPHVLEEHGMKRRKPRSPPRHHQVFIDATCGVLKKESSPLRFSAVIAWEGDTDYSKLYFEQPDHHAAIVSDIALFPIQSPHAPPPLPAKDLELAIQFLLNSGGADKQHGKVAQSKPEKTKARSYAQFWRTIARLKSTGRSDQ